MRPGARPRTAALALALGLLAVGCAAAGRDAAGPPSAATAAVDRPPGTTGPTAAAAAGDRPHWTAPPAGAAVSYQLGGPFDVPADVGVVDRDRTATPAPGAYGICYVNAFQTQPDEDAGWLRDRPDLLLRDGGTLVTDPGWPGEHLLDTSSEPNRQALLAVEGPWVDGCAASGFKAVELDNLDSYTRSHGRLTGDDALALAASLVERAHADGLAVAQKNTVELAQQGRALGFDFAVAEECQVYGECEDYGAVYGTSVIEVEYQDTPFAAACAAHRGTSVLLRDHDVTPVGRPGAVERRC